MRNNILDRRDFLRLGAAGIALASVPGLGACVRDPTTLPRLALSPNPAHARNQVLSHSVHLPVKPGETSALRGALARGGVFAQATPGVHFARAALLDARRAGTDQLALGIIYDQRIETALNFLTANGNALDAVLRHCEAYTPGVARDPVALRAYFETRTDGKDSYLVPDKLFFTAYDEAENEVRTCLAVQQNLLALLREADGSSDEALPYLVDRFLLGELPRSRMDDSPRPKRRRDLLPFSPHLTNTLTMVQPLMQGRMDPKRIVPCSQSRLERIERFAASHTGFSYQDAFEFILTEGEFAVKQLHEHPLASLHTLHFARIAVVEGRMLFASVYDGDFTQYVLDFGSRVADQIDFIWGLTEGYPPEGCRNVPAFIQWIRNGQVDVEDFFAAQTDVTLLQIQRTSALRRKLTAFSRSLPVEGRALRAQLSAFARDNQALLS